MMDWFDLLLSLIVMFIYGASLIVRGIKQLLRHAGRSANRCPTCLGWRRIVTINDARADTEPCPTCRATGKI